MLRILPSSGRERIGALLARRSARLGEAETAVAPILEAVRQRGDEALLEYARKFDGLERDTVRVDPARIAQAAESLTLELREAIETAAEQIRAFAQMQAPQPWMRETRAGVRLGQIVRPLASVGAYIPGGRYPLPSTLLMTVIPAQTAGVETISAASPSPNAVTLGAAGMLGVSNVFQMGGAQAIAALAFGTETVPKAQRIVGPGNVYVAAAKKLLAGETGIDFVAGPTEILLISSAGDPRHLAADMLAQAEHDVDAAAILLTTSSEHAGKVAAELEKQLAHLTTRDVAAQAIAANSAVIVCETLDEACEFSNRFAPEHLSVEDESLLGRIQNAGSVFIGPWSPEAAGDYAAGPNHVLPTSGVAALRGGLSILDYVKVISVQELSREGLASLAPAIVRLARAEGLEGHARSVEVRLGE